MLFWNISQIPMIID